MRLCRAPRRACGAASQRPSFAAEELPAPSARSSSRRQGAARPAPEGSFRGLQGEARAVRRALHTAERRATSARRWAWPLTSAWSEPLSGLFPLLHFSPRRVITGPVYLEWVCAFCRPHVWMVAFTWVGGFASSSCPSHPARCLTQEVPEYRRQQRGQWSGFCSPPWFFLPHLSASERGTPLTAC